MSIAFLFPGRGSQRPGMLHRLPDTAASATVLAEADWALRKLAARTGGAEGAGPGPDREYADGIVELDTQEALERSPVACHVALLIAGVAGARALTEDEGVRPAYVAGHGTGGYAAAVLAEVLTFEEALRAVRLRGELLHAAESTNAPESDVAIRLAQHLATIKRRPQSVTYVGGVQGRSLLGDTNAVFDDLAWSVARPVRWGDVTSTLAGKNVGCCVELPPGRVLTGQLAAELPGMRAVSVEEHGIAVAAELARSAAPGGSPSPSGPSPGEGASPGLSPAPPAPPAPGPSPEAGGWPGAGPDDPPGSGGTGGLGGSGGLGSGGLGVPPGGPAGPGGQQPGQSDSAHPGQNYSGHPGRGGLAQPGQSGLA